MKKPETPRTNTSATPSKGQDTISIDSKGNASAGQSASSSQDASTKPATGSAAPSSPTGATTSAKPESSSTASSKSSTSSTGGAKSTASASGGNSSASTAPSGSAKPGDKTPPPGKGTPQGKKTGKPAIMVVVWAVIIIGIVLALGWASRAMWWKQAEPTLTNILPQGTVDALAPEGQQNTAEMSQTPADDTAASNTANSETADSTSNSDSMASDTANKPDDGDNTDINSGEAATDETAPADATAPASTNSADRENTADTQARNVVVATDLTSRLSHLEGTINALRERLDQERGGQLNDSVARRLGELETRTAPIDEVARVQSELSGVATEMRDLSARMATVEQELKATEGLRIAGRGQAIGIGVALLRDAAQRGGPFEIALNQLNRSGSDDTVVQEQIAKLKPLAAEGAPRIEQLRQSFPVAADEAVKAASDDHSGGIWESTVANLKKLFPIRRVDAVGQDTLDGRLVTAEQALAADNLAKAISALEGVEGQNTKTALEPWLEKARARQTINEAIDVLSTHAIGLLTGQEDKTGNQVINTPTGSEAAQ
ncbi:COG4223 family protein [Thalassospira profundimaris]|uniref:COG4223 family protein n=1 Tax=Thalassospira profundimaris TaxID=502049 RepID=UPI000DED8762|nr:mitofilin family membrane protein [Thalassospira profundimaris]